MEQFAWNPGTISGALCPAEFDSMLWKLLGLSCGGLEERAEELLLLLLSWFLLTHLRDGGGGGRRRRCCLTGLWTHSSPSASLEADAQCVTDVSCQLESQRCCSNPQSCSRSPVMLRAASTAAAGAAAGRLVAELPRVLRPLEISQNTCFSPKDVQ